MNKQTTYSLIALLFILSGAIGLIYEIVWFKYLSLFLGNTTYAQSIVLATFLGGLAIGASLWGRRADHSRSPLRIYAVLEILIGVYCLFYPTLFNLLKQSFINIVLSSHLEVGSNSVLTLKLFTSLVALLPPTILMGGTLPVLVKHISGRLEDAGKNVAILYFLNSFGAVFGSLLGGFFLIRLLGLDASMYSAAGLNIIVGIAAFALTVVKIDEPVVEKVETIDDPILIFSKKEIFIAFLVAGLSGLCSMIYEVSWVRMMIPVLGSSTYSFSLMLVTFISGITFGSWIVSRIINRLKNVFGFLAICQLGVVLSLIATLPLYGYFPYVLWHTAHLLARTPGTYPIFLGIQLIFAASIMIIPTIFLGMSLPIASRIAATNINVLGKSVGSIFSVNTLGTVIGSLGTGLLLIPTIGIKHAIEFSLGLNFLLGAIVLLTDKIYSRYRKYFSLALITIFALLYFIQSPEWSKIISLSGVFRNTNNNSIPPASYDLFLKHSVPTELYFYKEGTTATVAVEKTNSILYGEQKVLLINGKGDASSKGDMPTQVLLAQFPMMLHPHPESTLVIGLGSGATAGSILTHPVKHVDCVEISPEVIEASHEFDHVNNKPLADPRFNLHIEDAIAFLKLANRNYDVIVSEPSNPWIAGIGNLYTTEFFTLCKQHLRKNGMMVQWFHIYEMDDETLQLVFRTFQNIFPNASIWQPHSADVVLIGSPEPIQANFSLMKEKLLSPKIKDDFTRISIYDLASILSLQVVSDSSLAEYIDYGDLNTEKLPLLEYWAPRSFFLNAGVTRFPRYDERGLSRKSRLFLSEYQQQYGINDTELLNIGILNSLRSRGNAMMSYSFLREYCENHPDDIHALKIFADVTERMERHKESIELYEKLMRLDPHDPEILEQYAWLSYVEEKKIGTTYTRNKIKLSEEILQQCIDLTGDTVDHYRAKLADIYYGTGEYQKSLNSYKRVLQIRQDHKQDPTLRPDLILLNMAQCARFLQRDDLAMGYLVQSYMVNPENQDVKDLSASIFMKKASEEKSKK